MEDGETKTSYLNYKPEAYLMNFNAIAGKVTLDKQGEAFCAEIMDIDERSNLDTRKRLY